MAAVCEPPIEPDDVPLTAACRDAEAHASAFSTLVAERRALGLERHAPAYLIGPSLLEPLALEAIDASNYALMELQRLAVQHPDEPDAYAAVHALELCCIAYAHRTIDELVRLGGPHLDVDALMTERRGGPVAEEYRFTEYLWRPSNYAELVHELADAHILCGFEAERRAHQRLQRHETPIEPTRDDELVVLADIAARLAIFTLDLEATILPNCPPAPDPRTSAPTAARAITTQP